MSEQENGRGYEPDPKLYDKEDFSGDIAENMKKKIRLLMEEQSQYASTSQTYMILENRIADATESLRNMEEADNQRTQKLTTERNKNAWRWQTAGQIFGTGVVSYISGRMNARNVDKVVDCEQNGGIVKSSAMKFIGNK